MNRLALPAIGGLLGILVVGVGMHYQAASLEDDTLVPSASTPATAGAARLPIPATPDRDRQLAAEVGRILARPLFSPDRRPPAGAAEASGGAIVLPRLSAVLVSSRGKSVIFAASADGKALTLPEGGRIGSYVVQSIEAGRVTLLGPDGPQVLRPKPDGSPAATLAAAPAGPSVLDLLRQSAPADALSVGPPGELPSGFPGASSPSLPGAR